MRLPCLLAFATLIAVAPVAARENCPAFPPKPTVPSSEAPERPAEPRAPRFHPVPNAGAEPALVFLGDSLTSGAGTKDRAFSYPNVLAQLLGQGEPRLREIYAIGGQGSTVLADLFAKVSVNPDSVFLIWLGRNNYHDPATVIADVQRVVQNLPNDKFLVLSVLSGRAAADPEPEALRAINAGLQSVFGDKLVVVGEHLTCDDWADNVHLNESGYTKIAIDVAGALRPRGW